MIASLQTSAPLLLFGLDLGLFKRLARARGSNGKCKPRKDNPLASPYTLGPQLLHRILVELDQPRYVLFGMCSTHEPMIG